VVGRFRAVLLGLSTGHALGLALVAGTFVLFALVSALLVPRRWPEFPGRNLPWFIFGTLVLFVATLGAVEVFAKEPKESKTEAVGKQGGGGEPGTTTQATQPAPAAQGDPTAGKAMFASQGCGTCHTYSPAGATGTVGPDLGTALKGKSPAFVKESIVDPNKEIAKGYPPNVMPQAFGQHLSAKQLDDLVAFLLKP
jgi:mono/diheme cytochrome c family protein